MGAVVKKDTLELQDSVNTPDFDPNEYVIFTKESDLNVLQQFRETPPGQRKRNWKVDADQLVATTAEERTATDAAELPEIKRVAKMVLSDQLNAWIETRYTPHNKETIQYLMTEAYQLGLTNRFNYFKQLGEWVKVVLGYYYQLAGAVDAQTTKEGVAAVQPNFEQFLLANPDPNVIILQGIQIQD